MTQPTDCLSVRHSFSAYLDGAVSGREMNRLASHLEICTACAGEFRSWRAMQLALSAAGPAKVPDDLGLRLRLAISHESARRSSAPFAGFQLRWTNFLRPALMQAAAGLASAVLLLGSLGALLGAAAAPDAVQAHDEPLGAMTQPHYLYSAARLGPVATAGDAPVVIEASVNARGEVYDYTVLSGPRDAETLAAIRDQLMLQVYEPARIFGQPVSGRVLVAFTGVSVRS